MQREVGDTTIKAFEDLIVVDLETVLVHLEAHNPKCMSIAITHQHKKCTCTYLDPLGASSINSRKRAPEEMSVSVWVCGTGCCTICLASSGHARIQPKDCTNGRKVISTVSPHELRSPRLHPACARMTCMSTNKGSILNKPAERGPLAQCHSGWAPSSLA